MQIGNFKGGLLGKRQEHNVSLRRLWQLGNAELNCNGDAGRREGNRNTRERGILAATKFVCRVGADWSLPKRRG